MQYFLLSSSKIDVFQTWTPAAVVEVNDDTTTFGCVAPSNPLRRVCRRIVTHRATHSIWIALVCLSTGMNLAVQPRYDMGDAAYKTLFALQVVCVAFFWLRMLCEIAASGFMEGRHSFLRSLWNWIELAVNVFAILQVIPPTFHIRWMRAVAAARPLRFFVYMPWWKQLLVPLARGFPYICDIFLVYTLCAFAFALIGVFSVGEELYQRCYITQVDSAASGSAYSGLQLPFLLRNVTRACGVGFRCPNISSGVTVDCLSSAADYENRFFTFQNVGAALLRMLKVASLDMWHEDLEDIMNVKGSAAALYPVAVVTVSQFLLVIAMTVVYNAYAHLDSWFVRSAVTADTTMEDRQRKDCGVQSVPPRQQQHLLGRQAVPPLLLRSHRGYGSDTNGDGDFSGDDGFSAGAGAGGMSVSYPTLYGPPALTAYSTAQATTTADERYARDFFHSVHLRGFWAGLRSLEQTTTPGPHGEPMMRWAAAAVDSVPSALFMMVLSIANLVLLALVSVYTNDAHADKIYITSSAMSIYFLLPFVLKLLGFGVKRTLMDVWNYTDVLGAVTGIVELAAPSIFFYRTVRILRVLRYLHVGKYFYSFQQYHYQLWCLLSLVLLWIAALLLYALVGMQLFGCAYVASDDALVHNGDFTTLWTALLACFRAFTGDVWTRYLTVVSMNTTVATGSLFFVSLEGIAMLLLFALENSILFRGFRDAARDEDLLNVKDLPPLLLLPAIKDNGGSTTMSTHGRVGGARAAVDVTDGEWAPQHKSREIEEGHLEALRRRQRLRAQNVFGIGSAKALQVNGNAFFFVSPFNPLRRLLLQFFGSFLYLILSTCAVLFGFVALFFERVDNPARRQRTLKAINIAYFVIFCVEMVLKWIAYGVFAPCVRHGDAGDVAEGNAQTIPPYFHEPLNWIDFIVNGTSLAGIIYAPLRIGRVLRTVRLCTTQERPNKTFLALIASLRHVAKTVPLIFALYVGFAVAGMQIFAGGMHYCNDRSISGKGDCVGTYNVSVATYTNTTLVETARVWERAAFHYDAFGPALLSVFAFTTTNHYGRLMDNAMAIVGSQTAMSYNHAGYYVIFFVLALLVIRLYALRGVAAVLAAKLRRSTMDSMGTALLTLQQTRFAVSRQSIVYMLYLDACLSPLPFKVSRWCHRVLTARPINGTDPLFYPVFNALLFIVCAFVAATHAYEPPWQAKMLLAVEGVGVGLCGIELVLNVVAYGGAHFLKAPRLLDAVLFGLLIVGVAAPQLRFFRVLLLVKLIKSSNIAMQLLPVVRHAGLLASAAAIYLIVLFIYAVVGTLVFGDVAPHGDYLTEKRNFSTVIGSLLVLFDCSTLDQWHLVMCACFEGAPCRSNPSAVCGHTHTAVPFFVSFVVVVNILAVQLVFAAMVNAFTMPLYVDVIEPFLQVRRAWLRYAGAENLKCNFDVFLRFLPHLPASLTDGLTNEKGNESSMIAFLSSLRLPLDGQLRLSYQDLLRGLAYRKYKMDLLRSGAEAYRRAALLSVTAGEHYGQLLRQRYCDEITRLAQTKVDAVHLNSVDSSPTSSQGGGVGDHETYRPKHSDFRVPKGAFPIPSSNVFLYTFPGESNEKAPPSPPQE